MKDMIGHVMAHLVDEPDVDTAGHALLLGITPQTVQIDHWMLAWVDVDATLGDLAEFLRKMWFGSQRRGYGEGTALMRATAVGGGPLIHNTTVHEAFTRSPEMEFVQGKGPGVRAWRVGKVTRYDFNRVAGIAATTARPIPPMS